MANIVKILHNQVQMLKCTKCNRHWNYKSKTAAHRGDCRTSSKEWIGWCLAKLTHKPESSGKKCALFKCLLCNEFKEHKWTGDRDRNALEAHLKANHKSEFEELLHRQKLGMLDDDFFDMASFLDETKEKTPSRVNKRTALAQEQSDSGLESLPENSIDDLMIACSLSLKRPQQPDELFSAARKPPPSKRIRLELDNLDCKPANGPRSSEDPRTKEPETKVAKPTQTAPTSMEQDEDDTKLPVVSPKTPNKQRYPSASHVNEPSLDDPLAKQVETIVAGPAQMAPATSTDQDEVEELPVATPKTPNEQPNPATSSVSHPEDLASSIQASTNAFNFRPAESLFVSSIITSEADGKAYCVVESTSASRPYYPRLMDIDEANRVIPTPLIAFLMKERSSKSK